MKKTLLTAVAALTFLTMGRGVCADDFALKRDEAFNRSLSQAIKKGMDPLVAREIKKEHTEAMRKIDDEYFREMEMEALREEISNLAYQIRELRMEMPLVSSR